MGEPLTRPVADANGAVEQLRGRFGERVSTSAAVREQHGKDESYHTPMPPDAVLFAEATAEVAEAVALCAAHKVPVIALGTGTSLEGHVAALEGGVCIDLSRMNRVLRVSAEDLDCTVEAGVTRKRFNEYLRDTGLFFPIDLAEHGEGVSVMRALKQALGSDNILNPGKIVRV